MNQEPEKPDQNEMPRESSRVFLVLGATGRTGRHFVRLALGHGHRVRALVRDPSAIGPPQTRLEVRPGSLVDPLDWDELVRSVDFVVAMVGNAEAQSREPVNLAFVRQLIPAMRRQGVKRFLYQAGGLTRPYGRRLPFLTWILKNTFARSSGLLGQHRDNEAVIAYLVEEAQDIEWMVHRAGIVSDGPSQGVLERSEKRVSLATFADCAAYNLKTVRDTAAVHTCDLSCYPKRSLTRADQVTRSAAES